MVSSGSNTAVLVREDGSITRTLPGVTASVVPFFVPERSGFVPERRGFSAPEDSGWLFFWGYGVEIKNLSAYRIKIKRRNWLIGDGEKQHLVNAKTIDGEWPTLRPYARPYRYRSGVPLRCRTGWMEGEFIACIIDTGEEFVIPVPRFSLNVDDDQFACIPPYHVEEPETGLTLDETNLVGELFDGFEATPGAVLDTRQFPLFVRAMIEERLLLHWSFNEEKATSVGLFAVNFASIKLGNCLRDINTLDMYIVGEFEEYSIQFISPDKRGDVFLPTNNRGDYIPIDLNAVAFKLGYTPERAKETLERGIAEAAHETTSRAMTELRPEVATPASADGLPWPTNKWKDSDEKIRGKKRGIIIFLQREWEPFIQKTGQIITRDILALHDPEAEQAFKKYLDKHEFPEGISIIYPKQFLRLALKRPELTRAVLGL